MVDRQPPGEGNTRQGLQRRAVGGLLWMLSGAGSQALLRLVLMLVLARLLGPEAFGIVGAALVVIHIALVFSNLGISSAIVQRAQLEDRHLHTAFALALGSGALITLVVALLAPWVAAFFDFEGLTDVLRAMALVPLLANLGVVAEGLLRRDLAFRRLAIIWVISFFVGYGLVGVTLALMGAGVWALVGASLTEFGARSTMQLASRPHPKTGPLDPAALWHILVFSGGLTLRRFGHQLSQGLDNIVVGRWLGAEALGLYGRAYQLVSMPSATLGKAMGAVMFPVLSRVQEDRARLAAAYRRSTAVIALLAIPAAAAVIVLAPELITVLLGEAWLGVIVPLQILAPGIFLRLIFQLSDALGVAAGTVYAVAWRQGAFAAAVLAGALIGQHWGLPGVAFGVLAAQTFTYLLVAQLSLRLTSLTLGELAAAHGRGLVLGALAGVILWLLVTILRNVGVAPAITLGGAVALLAAAALATIRLRLIGSDGLWLLESMAGRLPRRFALLPRLLGLRDPAAAGISS
ncbi:MAG: lipopolysaccharide biosynthesis protein [Geminicoccaceae bacterium]